MRGILYGGVCVMIILAILADVSLWQTDKWTDSQHIPLYVVESSITVAPM